MAERGPVAEPVAVAGALEAAEVGAALDLGARRARSPERGQNSKSRLCTNGTIFPACPTMAGPFYGQDGNYHASNVPKYSSANGTVTDSITGLTWEATPSLQKGSRGERGTHCKNLNKNGTGWRLPSFIELVSLLDYGENVSAVPPEVDVGTSTTFWTSSAGSASAESWSFGVGSGLPADTSNNDQIAALCVRGAAFSGSFVANGATVLDTRTNLEWEKARTSTTLTWDDALKHCEGSKLDLHEDWRLPNVKELATLFMPSASPAIDMTVFPEGNAITWSSTPYADDPGRAWIVSYGGMTFPTKMITDKGAVARCVRDAN